MPLPEARTSGMIRAAMHYAFAQELGRLQDTDLEPDLFARIVKDAIDNYGVEPAMLAARFHVTRPTASRWRSGDATPGLYLRREIVSWLASTIEDSAAADGDEQRGKVIQLYKYAIEM